MSLRHQLAAETVIRAALEQALENETSERQRIATEWEAYRVTMDRRLQQLEASFTQQLREQQQLMQQQHQQHAAALAEVLRLVREKNGSRH